MCLEGEFSERVRWGGGAIILLRCGREGKKNVINKIEARERNKTLNGLSLCLSLLQYPSECTHAKPLEMRHGASTPCKCFHRMQLFQYFNRSGRNLHVHSNIYYSQIASKQFLLTNMYIVADEIV